MLQYRVSLYDRKERETDGEGIEGEEKHRKVDMK